MVVASQKQAKYQQKRLEVLRAAARTFGRLGFHRASLADVAREIGMTPAALYYYMKSKDELLRAAVQTAVAELLGLLDAHPELAPIERIQCFFRAYARFAGEDFGRCLVLTDIMDMPEPYRQEGRDARRRVDRAVRDLARQAMDDGTLHRCNEGLLTNLLFGSFNGMARWWSPGGALTAEEAADRMLDIVLNGIASDQFVQPEGSIGERPTGVAIMPGRES